MTLPSENKRFLKPGKHVLMGNIAMAEGAIAAGLKFFSGYPITPSTEVPEHLSKRLPEVGGCFIQMEDELASINAVMGASLAGAKAMTATSGPGTSLMQETISYAANLEIPFVLCDVQRNGPGTGLVTAPHHNDLFQCKYGGNGEYEVIAIAPMSAQELFDLTIDAFNLAEIYRCPVYIMSDAYLGHIHEPVIIPPADELKERIVERKILDRENPEKFSYRDNNGEICVPPPPVLGTPNFPVFLISQPHGPNGLPIEEDRAQYFIENITRKLTDNVEKICRLDYHEIDDAEIIIVSYGLSARVSYRVVNLARKESIKVGLLRLINIWPFNYKKVKKLLENCKAIIMPEMNLGLMAGEIEKIKDPEIPLYKLPKIAMLHHPDEIMKLVKEADRK
ncbi:MAG: 2-oxoacid:acceptor oxidoreductase subunit alpha [Promethearchaeota archaeon]